MNYRHAYHAGNFADCLKHALLVWLLDALGRKPAPFFVLDTHAGAGFYDLGSAEAVRGGEWQAGIGRLLEDPPPPLVAYVGLVRALGLYPGSPALIRARLRPADRLACCELHEEEAARLRRRFARDPQVAVHRRDGWEAVGALLPPAGARRGLVLIDPPFEQPGEHPRILGAFATAARRCPGFVLAAWYPIKHRAPVRALHDGLRASGLADLVAAELWLRPPTDPGRLNGCGLILRHPPYGFEAAAAPMLGALRERLAPEAGAGSALLRLADG